MTIRAGQVERGVAVVVLHLGAGFVVQQQQLPKERREQMSSKTARLGTHVLGSCGLESHRGQSLLSTVNLINLYNSGNCMTTLLLP